MAVVLLGNLKFVIKWSCIKLCTQVQRYAKRPQLALCCNGPDNCTTTNQPYLLQFCNFPQNRGPTEQTFSCVNVSPGSGLKNTILETNDCRELSLRFESQRSGLLCCKAVMFSSVYDSCQLQAPLCRSAWLQSVCKAMYLSKVIVFVAINIPVWIPLSRLV